MIESDFDIVIPIGPLDINAIRTQIGFTKTNIIGYRNIYLVSVDPNLQIDGCITISESIFPFSLKTVEEYHGKSSRNGWFLQQLLKLYAGLVIPDILGRYLVIDSDTFFLKPITFDKNYFCYGTEYHQPYFEHLKKLLPSLEKMDPQKSGICHHQMFETKYLKELFTMVEQYHAEQSTTNPRFFEIFLKNVDPQHYTASGASEYEIYFNFMLKYHPDQVILRPLRWCNAPYIVTNANLDYVSCHWYIRQ